jgi:hypothetical protein
LPFVLYGHETWFLCLLREERARNTQHNGATPKWRQVGPTLGHGPPDANLRDLVTFLSRPGRGGLESTHNGTDRKLDRAVEAHAK